MLVLSLILCASAQQGGSVAKVDSVKAVQTIDKNALTKKTIINPKPPTNWSKIKDLFR